MTDVQLIFYCDVCFEEFKLDEFITMQYEEHSSNDEIVDFYCPNECDSTISFYGRIKNE